MVELFDHTALHSSTTPSILHTIVTNTNLGTLHCDLQAGCLLVFERATTGYAPTHQLNSWLLVVGGSIHRSADFDLGVPGVNVAITVAVIAPWAGSS
jgi:hypothetical protein